MGGVQEVINEYPYLKPKTELQPGNQQGNLGGMNKTVGKRNNFN